MLGSGVIPEHRPRRSVAAQARVALTSHAPAFERLGAIRGAHVAYALHEETRKSEAG
jgi:hypothetical protein